MAQKLNRAAAPKLADASLYVVRASFFSAKFGAVNQGNTVEAGHPMLAVKGAGALFAPFEPTFPASKAAGAKPKPQAEPEAEPAEGAE